MSDVQHEIKELEMDGKILMGPPILTRFEKARIKLVSLAEIV